MEFGQKNFFREIDLFDFTSFFGLDFFKFSGPPNKFTGKSRKILLNLCSTHFSVGVCVPDSSLKCDDAVRCT